MRPVGSPADEPGVSGGPGSGADGGGSSSLRTVPMHLLVNDAAAIGGAPADRWQGVGRALALTGALAGIAYVVWRTTSLSGVPGWLAWSALAVEAFGVVGSVLLVWATWSRRGTRSAADAAPATDAPATDAPATDPPGFDVVVRCAGQPLTEVLATLLSIAHADGRVVVDLVGDERLVDLSTRHRARYVRASPGDLDGLQAARSILARPWWLVLDAGDVLSPAAEGVLALEARQPRTAIVIPPAVTIERDGVHGTATPERFVRRSLLPALGRRGTAVHLGGPAFVRAEAVADLVLDTSAPEMVAARMSTALLVDGWRITAPDGPAVVSLAPPASPLEAEYRHAAAASAARWLLAGTGGALTRGPISPTRRLSLAARAVQPLSGVHRGLFVALVLAAVLDGRLPWRPDTVALATTWAPWFVLTPIGLWLVSRGAVRPGDRGSLSMRLLGPSWRGLLTPNGRPDRPRLTLAGAFGVRHGAAASGAVAMIAVVVGLRGLSDRLTHTLEPMEQVGTAGLLVVALWLLAMGLDALHLLARPARSRRSVRVEATLPATLSGRTALVVDLTPAGAGLLTDADAVVGTTCALDVVLPTRSGCVSAILPAVVRHRTSDADGADGRVQRLGVEFGDLDPVVHQALVEYCLVTPALTGLDEGVPTAIGIDPTAAEAVGGVRRPGLRAAALVAVVGAAVSAVPGDAAASGAFSAELRSSGALLARQLGAGSPATVGVDAASTVASWTVAVMCGLLAAALVRGLRPARLRAPVARRRRTRPGR